MTSSDRRELLTDRLADHLLTQGLGAATLRPMAAAVGTSDRMLLYYFGDRETLLAAVLARIAERLTVAMDAALPVAPISAPALQGKVRGVLSQANLRPYMQLWLEIATRAGRGEAPFRAIGEAIGAGFLAWTAARLASDNLAAREREALMLVATVDGLALLDSVGLGPPPHG